MIHFRKAIFNDAELYFKWANDKVVRENSYNKNDINVDDHIKWFSAKLKSEDCFFYLFLNEQDEPVGQVRIDKIKDEIIIGISIDEKFRGNGFGSEMLNQSSNDYLSQFPSATIIAYIKENNLPSLMIFKKAGFGKEEHVSVDGIASYKLKKQLNERY